MMRMNSSFTAPLVVAMALLSLFAAEARVNDHDHARVYRAQGSRTNKAKLEAMIRDQNLLPPLMRDEDLPIVNAGEKWKSLNQNVDFVPADGIDPEMVSRFLEQGNYYEEEEQQTDDNRMKGMDYIYDNQPFAYGEGDYDEYQQAWRLLGFIVDCNPMVDDDVYDQGGSGDDVTGEGCARYVLWAAYVDLEYEGGGIGEYQFFNVTKNQWDESACKASGNSRCAKMDCHLESTHFSLLGFFKHKSYDDWMEQLFKHEGICVWNDEEYAFMKDAREAWPGGCIDSYTTDSEGNEIYYDIKPVQGGDIEIGLYTDTRCITEYQPTSANDPVTVENILGNFFADGGSGSGDDYYYDFSSDTLEQSMQRWNNAFGKFRVCQPCVAYDLQNTDGSRYNDDGGGGGEANDMFDCYDDADYTNVNQCMKFMAKTSMNTATFRDMTLGKYQGTLTAAQLNGSNIQTSWGMESFGNFLTYLFLGMSVFVFGYGALYFYKAKVATNYQPTWGWKMNFKEPLVMS